MTRVDVVRLHADGYPFLQAFDDLAGSLVEGLQSVGHDSVLRHTELGPGRNVMLGCHLLDEDLLADLPTHTILYNFEQITPGSLLAPDDLDRFAGFEVWDYSAKNVGVWRDHGFGARHVPVGWSPGLERIERATDPDVDVLFYGNRNERRAAVLEDLERRGLRVVHLTEAYGAERDDWIARSKVVLNVHYYEAKILEVVRLSFLCANGVPVVSEWSDELEIPPGYEMAAAFAPYGRLADETEALVADPEARASLGARAQAAMQRSPWSATLPDELDTVVVARERTAPTTQGSGSTTRRAVLVLGCHRSGTSMLTRIINLGGFGITGPVIPAAEDNPAGFWEDQRVTLLNDHLLTIAGARWDGLTAPGTVAWRSDPNAGEVRRQLADHLAASPHDNIVIKDPRTTLLLPFWIELLAELGWEVQTVFALRDPLAVAESLRRRNGFSPVKAIMMWLSYNLIGETLARGTEPHLVSYEHLLADPAGGLSALHGALDMPTPLDDLADAAAAHMDSGLDRSGAPRETDYQFAAAVLARQTHAALLAGDHAALDALTERYLGGLELFLPMIDGLRRESAAAVERFS